MTRPDHDARARLTWQRRFVNTLCATTWSNHPPTTRVARNFATDLGEAVGRSSGPSSVIGRPRSQPALTMCSARSVSRPSALRSVPPVLTTRYWRVPTLEADGVGPLRPIRREGAVPDSAMPFVGR